MYITAKVIQCRYNIKIDTIFMNSKNNKTSDSQRLTLKLSDKISLKTSDKYVALSNLSIYYTRENTKINVETKIYNTFVLRGMLNSNYLMDRILHQIFKIISSISTNLKTELHLKLRKGIILNF